MMKFKVGREDRVTVVIPVRNRAKMLRRAVESVLAQSFRDFDLVVVDDDSTEDLSGVKCLVEGEGHHWLRLNENVGPAAARNAGAEVVVGEWLAFLDSDDVWSSEKLKCQLACFAEHPGMAILQCEEQWVRNGSPLKKKDNQQQPDGWIFEKCIEVCCVSPSCVMMSRLLWRELGGFDERYRVCEDYELWLRASLHNQVGLVKGESGPLVTRHGGHDDQLSFSVEAMDRFRVLALLELIQKQELTEDQRQVVVQGVLQRAAVLKKGAQKRGKDADAKVYGRAEQKQWVEMTKEMEAVCFAEGD
ncbi:MAG: glycosyltransferase family 2 protein [Verrucomicrobia bacterium]|nr:glycosyltransferase family 2 protein [Verrucomicrobiota bacterium]